MDTQIQTTHSAADLKTKITEHIQELAQATDAARISEEMQQYLDMCSKFHQYSPFNVWLIMIARPDASQVSGFKKWQTMGRYVRRGEHGIPILAPIFSIHVNDEGKEEQKLMGFKTVFVFDVSQTEGDPLPEPPDWKSPEKNLELMDKLLRLAQAKGIQIQVKHIGRDIQGVSLGGKIILDPEAGTKTMIHEIAHEILHHSIKQMPEDPKIRELEAEGTAYVVATHFGLNGLASPNYVALYGATAELIICHMERIRETAAAIINAIENGSDAL
jgi:hypothetical protein